MSNRNNRDNGRKSAEDDDSFVLLKGVHGCFEVFWSSRAKRASPSEPRGPRDGRDGALPLVSGGARTVDGRRARENAIAPRRDLERWGCLKVRARGDRSDDVVRSASSTHHRSSSA